MEHWVFRGRRGSRRFNEVLESRHGTYNKEALKINAIHM
jgi:hypothetical protein